ncbi:hypothetical protein ACOXDG_004601, partial [Enterobacter hormaechei]
SNAGREPKGARSGIQVFSEDLLIGFQSRHATPRHATPRHATPRRTVSVTICSHNGIPLHLS